MCEAPAICISDIFEQEHTGYVSDSASVAVSFLSRPHGLSTKMRVLAFCSDDQIEESGCVALSASRLAETCVLREEMLEAGADVAGVTMSQVSAWFVCSKSFTGKTGLWS